MLGYGALSERALSEIATGGAAAFQPEDLDGGWSLADLGTRLALAAGLLVGPAAVLAQQPTAYGAANDAIPTVTASFGAGGPTILVPTWGDGSLVIHVSSGADQWVPFVTTFVDDDPGGSIPPPMAWALPPRPIDDQGDLPGLLSGSLDDTGPVHAVVWPAGSIPAPWLDDPVVPTVPAGLVDDDPGYRPDLPWTIPAPPAPIIGLTSFPNLSGTPDDTGPPDVVVWPGVLLPPILWPDADLPSIAAALTVDPDAGYQPPPTWQPPIVLPALEGAHSDTPFAIPLTYGGAGVVIQVPVWGDGLVVFQSSGADQWVPSTATIVDDDPGVQPPAPWPMVPPAAPVLDDGMVPAGSLRGVYDDDPGVLPPPALWVLPPNQPLTDTDWWVPAAAPIQDEVYPAPTVAPALWPLPPIGPFTDDGNGLAQLSGVPDDSGPPALVVWPWPVTLPFVADGDYVAPVLVDDDPGYRPEPTVVTWTLGAWVPVDPDYAPYLGIDDIPAYVPPLVWPTYRMPMLVVWASDDAGALSSTTYLDLLVVDQSGPRWQLADRSGARYTLVAINGPLLMVEDSSGRRYTLLNRSHPLYGFDNRSDFQ